MKEEFKIPERFSGFPLEFYLKTPPFTYSGGAFTFSLFEKTGFMDVSNMVTSRVADLNQHYIFDIPEEFRYVNER